MPDLLPPPPFSPLLGRAAVWLLAILGVALVALAITPASDLAVSVALVTPDSPFATAIQRWGEVPGLLVASLALWFVPIPIGGMSPAHAVLRAVGHAGAVFYVLWAFAGHGSLSELGRAEVSAGIALALAAGAALTWARRRVHVLPTPEREHFWRVTLALAIGGSLVVLAFKLGFGRIRFREMLEDLDQFSPWWIPHGLTGHASFPSGHTFWSWVVLPIVALVPPRRRVLALVAALAWPVTVALGRVVAGAHFLSDVLFASVVAVLVVLLAERAARRAALASEGGEKRELD
ncbi:MAG: phosphatase PAP2 family protein [Myxococcales bacterium]|nr:phosphatase PAP2 family protein [Myxococcales bacterium]MCB9735578.1 phosphatase PAP2 family protein [Deltaproteobacteria bacterium]